MLRALCTTVAVRFWADYPNDGTAADAHVDLLSGWIEEQIELAPTIVPGSVHIEDFDTRAFE